MKIKILAFTGKLESGKSTAAAFAFMNLRKYNPVGMAFARPMKDIAEQFFHFSEDQLYTTEGKSRVHDVWKMSAREFLQKFGQGMRDLICSDVWVKLLELQIQRYEEDPNFNPNNLYKVIVIDDLRMNNEAEMLKKHGATIIKMERPDHEQTSTGVKNHPSEAGIDQSYIDHVIVNDGNTKELCEKVEDLLKSLGW